MRVLPAVATGVACLVVPAVALAAIKPGDYEGKWSTLAVARHSVTFENKQGLTQMSGRCSDTSFPWKPGVDPMKMPGPVPVVGQDLVYKTTFVRNPPTGSTSTYKYRAVVRFTTRHRAEVRFTMQYTKVTKATGATQTCKASGKDVVKGPS